MSTIAIDRKKLTTLVHELFPRLKKPENIADVLIAAKTLGATSFGMRKSAWKLVLEGARRNAVDVAFDLGLLERKRASRKRILKSSRGSVPADDSGVLNLLSREREALFKHIMAERKVKKKVLQILGLRAEDGITAIRASMENGSVPAQIYHYDKVVTGLIISKLYSRSHGYLWMGFRFFPHTYWLSKLGEKLIAQATS